MPLLAQILEKSSATEVYKSVVFLSCFCIKQISSIRSSRFHACCRVSLQQVRKSLTHTGVPRVPLFLFLPHLTSYLISIKINSL